MNEDTKAKIRKYKKNLVITGLGFMAIELWAVIKFAIKIVQEGGFRKMLADFEIASELEWVIVYLFFAFFFVLITLLHIYIGLSAARYGTGRSKKKGFLVAAGIYVLLTVSEFPSLVSDFVDQIKNPEKIYAADTTIASFLVELTILFILLDMIFSAIRLKRTEKKLA